MHLFIDSDGTDENTDVLVIGEDGTCLGELQGVTGIQWSLVSGMKAAEVHLVMLTDVPGRFLADKVLINELKLAGVAETGLISRLSRSLSRVLSRG